ncbi:MAG: heavy metal translocating P-type ATPase [Syntrophomonadaceae bacterium]|jgi:Cd2+/Zn2+-exporting ATPase
MVSDFLIIDQDFYTDDSLRIIGMDCPDCAAKVLKTVKNLPGVIEANLVFPSEKMHLTYDPEITTITGIIEKIRDLGYDAFSAASPHSHRKPFEIRVVGLDCADCAANLEKRIKAMPGVEKAMVSFGNSKLEVSYPGPIENVLSVIERMGYQGILENKDSIAPEISFWKTNKYAISCILSGIIIALAVLSNQFGAPAKIYQLVYLLAILVGGYLPVRTGISMLVGARSIDMNVLMMIAVIGAVLIGEVEEGAIVVFLFALGNTLQAYTLEKTRNSIRSLMELTPQEALVKRNNMEKVMPLADIKIGDIVVVRPGERIPMDGKVTAGASAVDQAAITGESIPVDKGYGDDVFAGTINQSGALEIKVTKLARDNTIARLIALVDEAQGKKAKSQEFIDRFARYYTPVVISCAAVVATVPPLLLNQSFSQWVYQALAMLLVACPCALVISTPVSIVTALGNAARNGVLIKGGIYLEQMARLTVVALDKTGTLTQGKPEVTDIISTSSLTENEVLTLGAAIESRSEHPLGKAIVKKAGQNGLKLPAVTEFRAIMGRGATGVVNGCRYFIGSKKYVEDNNIEVGAFYKNIEKLEQAGKTVILLCSGEDIIGLIALADILRPISSQAVKNLKQVGINKVIMLTGDNPSTARTIAIAAGVDDYRAQLLPEDKVSVVQDLLRRYGKVAMVGDGINDAPAMATATVGIAMGAAGTDAAIETADVALMADDLSKLSYAIHLSRRTLRIMKQNVVAALVLKGFILALVIPGMLTMWLAVLGDMGASLLVILNGLRLLRIKDVQLY